eukprot:gene9606-biopygen12240
MRRRRRRPGENERKIRAIRGKYGGEADFSGTVLYWMPSMSGSLGDLRRGEGAIPRPWNAEGVFDEVSDDDSEGEAAAALLEQLRK